MSRHSQGSLDSSDLSKGKKPGDVHGDHTRSFSSTQCCAATPLHMGSAWFLGERVQAQLLETPTRTHTLKVKVVTLKNPFCVEFSIGKSAVEFPQKHSIFPPMQNHI